MIQRESKQTSLLIIKPKCTNIILWTIKQKYIIDKIKLKTRFDIGIKTLKQLRLKNYSACQSIFSHQS